MSFIDLTGLTFDRLTVVQKGNGRKTSGGQQKTTWICKCKCGNIVEVDSEKLRNGHTGSCGCLKRENTGRNFQDLTGQQFNRLIVVRRLKPEEKTTKTYNWLCKCDCGNYVKANAYKLKNNLQQSCGCLKEEMKSQIGEITRKYKHSNKRLYSVYKAMLDRCYNPKQREYHNYGGRGIAVCAEWLGEYGYDTFAEWAFSSGYDENAKRGDCTLERIIVDGNYEPSNCKWITNEEQQENRRDTHRIEYNGEIHSIAKWARVIGVNKSTLYRGINKEGKTLEYYIKKYIPTLIKKES